ncbi:phage major capsid protein [Streptomyces indicus]|uniref:Phage major capsid protein, HK97 family n=1 Tax=Streptomyces indicus TaxID=417292 RepID=A0A1G8W8E5_9ACTN|nr:phage major capsid protein [Streptomyces indicus]SDJ74604.1 phage major capsid protein, HK97 family [Streptomyces indicus]
MADTPVKLSAIEPVLLPPEITGPIFDRTTETSAVMRLADRVPLSMVAETAIPISLDVPVAGWVKEGGPKPTGTAGKGAKKIHGEKVAVLVPISQEVANNNAAGLYSQVQRDLPVALARAFDMAAIHGKTLLGSPGPFDDFLTATPYTVQLGAAAQNKGGVWADLVNGMKLVVDGDDDPNDPSEGYDVTGWVGDPRLRPELLLATDLNGRPIFVDTTTPGVDAVRSGTLLSEPLTYSRAISGKLVRQSGLRDSGLRLIGGDFSQCAYGVGMDITLRISTEAGYVDADGIWHSAFQENLVLVLAEAYFGFVVGNPKAFVTLTAKGGSS